MNNEIFYFKTADEVLAEVDKVLATLKANGVENLLDDGCDNENEEQNARFCAAGDAVDEAMKSMSLLEMRSGNVLDTSTMKNLWQEVCAKHNSHDAWLNGYNRVLDYYEAVKKMADKVKKIKFKPGDEVIISKDSKNVWIRGKKGTIIRFLEEENVPGSPYQWTYEVRLGDGDKSYVPQWEMELEVGGKEAENP